MIKLTNEENPPNPLEKGEFSFPLFKGVRGILNVRSK